MASMWGKEETVKKLPRVLLPKPIRPYSMLCQPEVRLLGHDWIYGSDDFETFVEGPAARSSGRILGWFVGIFSVRSVIDVGCGTGALLETLSDRGCEVFGLERSAAPLDYCRARRLNVVRFDLEREVFRAHE